MEGREQIEHILRWSLAHLPDGEILLAGLGGGAAISMLLCLRVARYWQRVHGQGEGRVQGDATPFDLRILREMHALESRWLTAVARFLAYLGSPPVILVFAGIGTVCGIFFASFRGAAWTLPVAIVGAALLIQGLKSVFRRPRPTLFQPLLTERGYSFPYGHSLIAIVVYGLLGYFLLRLFGPGDGRILMAVGIAALIVLIGLSRIYVGVHYPVDVIAGWVTGLPWLVACIWLQETLARHWHQPGAPVFDFRVAMLLCIGR